MRRGRTALVVLGFIACAAASDAGSQEVTLELTGREDSLAVANDVIPDQADQVVDPDPACFALRQARAVLSWSKARVHLQWVEEPDFTVSGSRLWAEPPGARTDTTASSANHAGDLGVGYQWRPSEAWTLVPWLGLARVEQSFRWHDELRRGEEVERETTLAWAHDGWGAGVGLELAGSPLRPWLVVEARLVSRWTTGATHVSSLHEDLSTGPEGASETSGRSSVSMWGVEAGVGATTHGVSASIGWSLRDWSTDFGPGRVAGPYARLAARF